MMRSMWIYGFIFLFCIKALAAQETEPDANPLDNVLPGFKGQAVILNIKARVIEQNMTEIWNEEHQRVTIPGRPVGIKIVGSNIIVDAQFIPYLRRRGQSMLVAQGQIWIDVPNHGLRYQTTMQTIPIAFNEPVYFFPLGSAAQSNEARIEIMLTMRQYSMEIDATGQITDSSKQ